MKRLLAKKTANIKDARSKRIVSAVKGLQSSADELSKCARKLKQTLKNSKDVEDPSKIEKSAKEMFKSGNHSIISNILSIFSDLGIMSAELRMHNTATKIGAAVRAIKAIPDSEQPETSITGSEK